jgi:AcrR family transcriptional regulator
VAIGTVFRHFPTKEDLLRAIMKGLLERLADDVGSLQADGDPATALFTFFTRVVEQAAAKKSVIELLAQAGVEVGAAGPVQALREAVEGLLTRAQQAGAVRGDVQISEVMALLASTAQGALHSGWDPDLQRRTLAVIFAGLRAAKPADAPGPRRG